MNNFRNLQEVIDAAQATPFAAMFNPHLFFEGMRFIVREELKKLEEAAEKEEEYGEYMTKKEVSNCLKMCIRTVDSRVAEGLLRIVKRGPQKVFFLTKEVMEYKKNRA